MVDKKFLVQKYTAWAKYPEKYTAKQVLTEIVPDVKQLEEVPEPVSTDKWISVKDRLPEEPIRGEKIPVLIAEGFNGPVYEAFYEGGGDFCTSMYENYLAATHWMPIPNPPNKQ